MDLSQDILFHLSASHRNWGRTNSGAYKFQCPYCVKVGKSYDPKGYLWKNSYGQWRFKCFKGCRSSISLKSFLQDHHPTFLKSYEIANRRSSRAKNLEESIIKTYFSEPYDFWARARSHQNCVKTPFPALKAEITNEGSSESGRVTILPPSTPAQQLVYDDMFHRLHHTPLDRHRKW